MTKLTAAAQTATADGRVVSGLVLPYGPVGHTSVGPVRVLDASRVRVPAELSRIKLMDYHQDPPVAVGVCTALRHTAEGMRASFRLASTPAAEAALLEVTEGLRDGLSVELGAIQLDGDELLDSELLGVALVPIPAWADARHDGLAAARQDDNTTTEETQPMTDEQRARLRELLAMNARSPEDEAEFSELVTLAAAEGEATEEPAPTEAQASATPQLAASHATVPAGLQRTPATVGQRPLAELYAAQSRVMSGTSRPELEAALLDITTTANIWTTPSSWDGLLWAGLEYKRKYVPLMVEGPLPSYKGNGWKWGVKPVVADYAGDKTAVPSNQPTTVATTWTAARLAGAHDIDRKFFDFGDQEFIGAYYDAMRESYARQSDDKARAAIIAAANSAGAAGAGFFRALATVASAVETNTGGITPDYFLVSAADRLNMISTTESQIPAYLEAFGVTPDKIIVASGVAAGTVIGGAKQAMRWRELGGSPIRVEALRIANGGVDGGVFGYYATEEVFDGGVVSATFT